MKRKTWIIAWMLTAGVVVSMAQEKTDTTPTAKTVWPSFLTKDQLPDGTRYLPAPPAFDSRMFIGDLVWYHWGKSLRDTPRGEQAIREAELNAEALAQVFSPAFGLVLSAEETPETYDLLSRVITDACNATSKAKKYFNRERPFLYFNEGSLIPEEEPTHHTPSYPSSHSAAGWAVALVLTELAPARQEGLLNTGYEYGQSRVIAGYHYETDVEAARMAASACVARLHADEAFQKQMKKVRKELEKKRK